MGRVKRILPLITIRGSLYGNELQANNLLLRVVDNEGYPQLKTGFFILKKVDSVYWRIIFAIFPKN
jgi:hypothetical protein